MERLRQILSRIDRRGYKAYKEIAGSYNFGTYTLFIDYVQGDPFAGPSAVRVRVNQSIAKFPEALYSNPARTLGTADSILRQFCASAKKYAKQNRGSGKSGLIDALKPSQEVLLRSSVVINQEFVEVRFWMGLPAFGRTIAGREAMAMFFEELPLIVKNSMFYSAYNPKGIKEAADLTEDQEFLRRKLPEHKLVAFIANNSLLPRKSGIDPRPMSQNQAVLFQSPKSLEVEFHLPHHGPIRGMGIPEGITLIVGGGYHGKTTLLSAIELGVYNHKKGDGREFVITVPDAVKIRAEDGRSIANVDISPFIDNLPLGKFTQDFSTEDASGSTSQAANIIEALEAGATLLLIDEDTSATNFMIRDERMQRLISKDKEPITPFIDKVKLLYEDYGVSTVLVIGGSGDYFDVADTVIAMENYLPKDVTVEAKKIAEEFANVRKMEGGKNFGSITARIPIPNTVDLAKGKREVYGDAKGKFSIMLGKSMVDLSCVEQIVEIGQTRTIAQSLTYILTKLVDGKKTIGEILDILEEKLKEQGLDFLREHRHPSGAFAFARRHEIASALNRIRGIRMKQQRR